MVSTSWHPIRHHHALQTRVAATATVRAICNRVFLGLVGVVAALAAVSAPAQESNSVVAVVNADPITRQMLSDATLARYGESVLDNVIINRQLILQACKDGGIEVTQAEVGQEITRLATKFGFSVQDYLKLLQEERDIDPGQYGREIVWPMLALRKLVADQVQPTEEEFNQAFLAQYGEAVKCRMIMVAKEQTARSLHREALADPQAFGNLAKMHSEDESSASVGGLIPPIRRYTGDSRLEEAAFSLKDNEISPVMQLADQWIFLQAVRRIPATTPAPAAMPAIREQINDRIRDQKMRGAAAALFADLQRKANVVKVFGDAELSQKYPGVAAIVNEQSITLAQLAAECVKRHGADVLDGEINRKLLTQALKKADKSVTQADLQQEIERAAKSYGFIRSDGTADLQAWTESVTSDGETTEEIYVKDAVWPSVALKKLVEQRITVTDEDLQRGFESAFGSRVEVLACVLSDQRTAQKVWKMARDNPSEEFFGRLAEQYSIEPVSASNSGKVPPIRKFSGQPTIEREAFALQRGQLSGIIATGDKYIILKCQGRTEPVVSDLSAVKAELVRDLTEKKFAVEMAAEFDRLKESAQIDNFYEAAKEIASTGKQVR
ncbi:peptidylprolyl isomerase [Roseiconus nitratireducens]|uniref:peptidylprolyl isomerase n=1 Tax=Roseiconus nitratireducens TaxID=2605748 RepID=A0A5M6D0S5_9BACT|nr:peptidylprolyl isomerase [Roseiconus nitratireducens]KAA5540290.1 peptidylprolyl isomerase [Roseiconus nitratireducens]